MRIVCLSSAALTAFCGNELKSSLMPSQTWPTKLSNGFEGRGRRDTSGRVLYLRNRFPNCDCGFSDGMNAFKSFRCWKHSTYAFDAGQDRPIGEHIHSDTVPPPILYRRLFDVFVGLVRCCLLLAGSGRIQSLRCLLFGDMDHVQPIANAMKLVTHGPSKHPSRQTVQHPVEI